MQGYVKVIRSVEYADYVLIDSLAAEQAYANGRVSEDAIPAKVLVLDAGAIISDTYRIDPGDHYYAGRVQEFEVVRGMEDE
jgi:hypothetical protein